MGTMFDTRLRELDSRSNDGVDVTLLWDPRTNGVFVVVSDDRLGDSFRIDVDAAVALDAFRHPYAYADRRFDGEFQLAA